MYNFKISIDFKVELIIKFQIQNLFSKTNVYKIQDKPVKNINKEELFL